MNQTFNEPCGPLRNFWIQMFLFYIILRVVFVILCLPFTIYTSESDVFVSGKNCLLFGGPQWCPPVFATICADDRFAQVLLLTPVQKELRFWKTDNLYCPCCFVVKERMMMQSNWNSVETFFLLSNYWNFSPSPRNTSTVSEDWCAFLYRVTWSQFNPKLFNLLQTYIQSFEILEKPSLDLHWTFWLNFYGPLLELWYLHRLG